MTNQQPNELAKAISSLMNEQLDKIESTIYKQQEFRILSNRYTNKESIKRKHCEDLSRAKYWAESIHSTTEAQQFE